MFKLGLYLLALILPFFTTAQSSSNCFEEFKKACFYDSTIPNYSDWQERPECFSQVILCLNEQTSNDRLDLAYLSHYINLHNFLLLKNITEEYPVVDLRYAQHVYTKDTQVNGEFLSPNSIKENQLKSFIEADPRILFLLWDGTYSGPKYDHFPVYSSMLNPTLREVTEEYLSDSTWVKYQPDELSLLVSPYFTKHRSFFLVATGGIINFLNLHKPWGIGNLQMGRLYYDYDLREQKDKKNKTNKIWKTFNNDYKFFTNGMIVPHKQLDLAFWSGLYSEDGAAFDQRKSYASQLLQVTYGTSANNRWNLGFGLEHKTNHFSYQAGAFEVYQFSDTTGTRRSQLSSARLFFTFSPKESKSISFQTELDFPLTTNLEAQPFLAYDNIFVKQGLFVNVVEGNGSLYASAKGFAAFGLKEDDLLDAVGLEAGIITSYFLVPRFAIMLSVGGNLRTELGEDKGINLGLVTFGFGQKLLISERFLIESLGSFYLNNGQPALGLGLGLRKQF